MGNDHPFPPEIQVDSPYLQQRIKKLHDEISEIVEAAGIRLKTNAERRALHDEWRKEGQRFLKEFPTGWSSPTPEVVLKMKDTNAVPATNFTVQADATVTFSDAAKESTWLTLPLSNMWLAAVRLEIVPHEEATTNAGPKKRKAASVALSAGLKPKGSDKETKLTFYHGEADHKQDRFAMSQPIIGVIGRWQISTEHDSQTAVWLLAKPVKVSEGDVLTVNLGNAGIASARVSVTPFAAEEPLKAGTSKALSKALARSNGSRAERDLLSQTFLLSTAWDADAFAKVQKLLAEVRGCREGRAFTMVAESREPMVLASARQLAG